MFASRLFILTTLVACTVVPATQCRAQAYGLEGIVEDNDLRWFEPAELDLDGRLEKEAGYFLKIKKEGLFITGERAEIGDPNTVVLSEQLYATGTIEQRQKIIDLIYSTSPTGAAINLSQLENDLGIQFQQVGGVIVTAPMLIDIVDDQGAPSTQTIDVPQIDTVTEAPPVPYTVRNSILDATPKAELGWGEEYEFGYSDGERGWMARVLDGPEVNSGGTYGSGEGTPYTSQSGTGFADFDPYFGGTPQDLDGDGVLDTIADVGDIYALGFGSVAVNFDAPEDFFVGFRDYIINTAPTSGTQWGIINYVGNYGGLDDNEDFDDDDTEVQGIADDLDGDLDSLFVISIDTDGDGDPDTNIGTVIDYGDLYKFNVFFDQVDVRNRVEMDGVELMFTHELDRGHKLDRGRRDDMQLRYGVSFLRFRDDLDVDMLGSVLGRTFVDHEVDNQLVGPTVGLRWRRDHGNWDFSLDTQVSLAYNIVDHRQNGIFGEELIPGALNRPINGRTTTAVDSLHDDDFSPMAEIRAEARYKITKALALTLGYKAKFIDNIQRSTDAVGYTAPYWSINNKKSDVFINGITMGVEFRH